MCALASRASVFKNQKIWIMEKYNAKKAGTRDMNCIGGSLE